MSIITFLETKTVSSLVKVFADAELNAPRHLEGTALANEVYSFQVAYRWSKFMLKEVCIKVVSDIAPCVTVRKVESVPVEMPVYGDHDDNILRGLPGLYPDILVPPDQAGITLLPRQWRSLWITINLDNNVEPGIYPIDVIFESKTGEMLGKENFQLTVLEASLPKQTLIHTEWFHSDCIATWYKTEIFSNKHWDLLDKYIKTAVEHGINMILTPIFTPPLDTMVGGERPTVQLVEVNKNGDTYTFGFQKLKKWISMCKSNGIEYFEFSHLFTQWGAKHAPKIMATINGEYKRIFGWETDAAGVEYKSFLDEFLPCLIAFIKENQLENCSYFHVSDEPSMMHLESYENANNIIKKHVEDFPVIDALSDYTFYEKGLVKNPIPANNHIEAFLENNVPNLWTYYCCGQYKKVSNRFIDMPSARNRILGLQLYKYGIVGFLQWGYNFWYSQYSRFPIDPFRVTDGAFFVPAGDAFLVYPGKEGPLESIRMEVFYEALQDLRALQSLEIYIGKEAVVSIIEDDLDTPITFSEYPKDATWLIQKRDRINRMIEQCRQK